jgi:hypothetical protein
LKEMWLWSGPKKKQKKKKKSRRKEHAGSDSLAGSQARPYCSHPRSVNEPIGPTTSRRWWSLDKATTDRESVAHDHVRFFR